MILREVAMHTWFRFFGAAVVTTVAGLFAFGAGAQTAPKFEIDASWPKDLPEGWITGQLGGVCTDADDNVYVVNRRDITEEEKETAKSAPSIIKFDAAGKVVASWGDPNVVPGSIHGCYADHERNLWVGGNNDGIVQKYAPDGKLLLQIGTRGKFDSADGTAKGKGLNANPQQLFNPSSIAIDEANGDVYVADGYGNRRVVVFDRDGKFLRQWGRQATKAETEAGEPGVFSEVVHCIAISRVGLVYVCDRQGDRVEVFDKTGKFVRNIWIRTGTPNLPDPRGTAWWVSFSPDPEQKFMYVMNGRNEQVHILDHASGKILASFGRPGHQSGNFTHGHTMAIDSKGNLYVAETNFGRRIQKFKVVGGT
jgi:DNA-binding beta-propeller fold protein YncE